MPKGTPNFELIIAGDTLIKVHQDIGFSGIIKSVSLMLSNLCSAFNVSKNMNKDQILDYAITLVEQNQHGTEDDPSFRIEDFAVFFEYARRGNYGKPFDYVDATLIQEWLLKYKEERYNDILARHDKRKNQNPERAKDKDEQKLVDNYNNFMQTLRERITAAQNLRAENEAEQRKLESKRLRELSENRAKEYWGDAWEQVERELRIERQKKFELEVEENRGIEDKKNSLGKE